MTEPGHHHRLISLNQIAKLVVVERDWAKNLSYHGTLTVNLLISRVPGSRVHGHTDDPGPRIS